jgi:hypothetical protein
MMVGMMMIIMKMMMKTAMTISSSGMPSWL